MTMTHSPATGPLLAAHMADLARVPAAPRVPLLDHMGRIALGGRFSGELIRNGRVIDEFAFGNIFVNQGLDTILDVVFRGASAPGSWFVGLFQGSYSPVATVTAATIASTANELVDYDEATRPAWTPGALSNRTVSNSAARATFTFNAARTVRGAFLVNSSVKNGTAGVLAAAAAFGTPRSVVDDDQILLTYTLSAVGS